MRAERWLLWAGTLLLTACASQPPQRVQDFGAGNDRIELKQTAFFPNDDQSFAASALATLLYTDGLSMVGPEQVAPFINRKFAAVDQRPALLNAARHFDRLPYVLAPTPDAVFAEVKAGTPVLVLQKLANWRYSVVIGVEPGTNRVILRSGKDGRVYQPLEEFLRGWKASDNWALVVSDGVRVAASATQERWIAAGEAMTKAERPDLAERNAEGALKRWPGTVVPWVALGNARYAAKNFLGAQEAYLESLKLKAENPVVRNNLALVLLERHCVDLAEQQVAKAIASETDAGLKAIYETTRVKISQYEGPSIYCPPPDDAEAPIEYEIAPLNPEKPRASRVRPKAPAKPKN